MHAGNYFTKKMWYTITIPAINAANISGFPQSADLRMVADKQSFEEWDTGLETANPLDYPGYPEKLTD